MTEPFAVGTGTSTAEGDLTVPADAIGVVVFAHGSGSSRHSPRNQAVARALQDHRFATLLFDLLSADEDNDQSRFDIGLLRDRLLRALDDLGRHPGVTGLPVGLFGASTGAAAALSAAAARPDVVRAVVSRGGRPDLAEDALAEVRCPVLLIVGGNDDTVRRLNKAAAGQLPGDRELVVVPGAGHLFEEPGALEQVAEAAAGWFERHLPDGGDHAFAL
ncbi:dienelactone hydrolase family protein [Amycolatopsis echigonensis]|uniref:Alpha/beta fold hydrolase n=1 Tax=Amycolatopsis echigonensis TaxID=2576905 RepID=A0A8E1VYD3_9PSEU|nr:alpha/beta fold hydrolase [Amycolatopsis echigonensis]MBB2500495.1 alpha/beta fold hydrolase [Amycolatopsis echigonensis]